MGGWLGNFDAISVRDENSSIIVEKLTGKSPEYYLDPVLIYDFAGKCKKIPDEVPESGYMILYGYAGRFTDSECCAVSKYAEEKELKIFCIGGIQACCDKFIDCNPFQVIAYFRDAECVVTDTFHGTILSVITHKCFGVFVRDKGYGNSEKLADLLKRLGLESRRISKTEGMKNVLEQEFDYGKTDQIIDEGRRLAKEYLREQIIFE